jgi:hypothetical protein
MNGLPQIGREFSAKKVFSKQSELISKRVPIDLRKNETPKNLE